MEQEPDTTGNQPLSRGQLRTLDEYRRRLEYLAGNYRFWSRVLGQHPTINESLALLKRSLRGAPRRPVKVRLNPEIEIAVSMLATGATEDGSVSQLGPPEPDDVIAACEELVRRMKPKRGAPGYRVLRHHVQALMVLSEWATGAPVTASPTTGSDYQPQMTSAGAKLIEHIFQSIDPSIATTTLMNIVRTSRQQRQLEGKRFEDFFPGYGMSFSGDGLGGPNALVIKSGIAHPIYCS